jgi:hypothetical protein
MPDNPNVKKMRLLLDSSSLRDGFTSLGDDVNKQHVLVAIENILLPEYYSCILSAIVWTEVGPFVCD